MDLAPPGRLTIGAVIAALMAFAAIHRLRAHTSEPLDRTQEGWFLLVAIRVTGLLVFAATAMWLREPDQLGWASIPLPSEARWIGTALLMAAALWLGWMFRTLGRNITDTVVTRREAVLVTGGPYRYVRNPMYLGLILLTTGLGMAQANALAPSLGLVLFALLAARTKIEERFLIARFGDAYRAYMRKTGRFFPGIGLG